MRILISLFFLGAAFGGSYYFGKEWRSSEQKGSSALFAPTLYPVANRSFSVAIIGFNNGAFVEKTLQSVFAQNYLDFRIFYIDDASDDGSFELARDLIYDSGQMMRVTIFQNEKRLGVTANLARIVQEVPDHEIVVVLGGEDWLAHEWVLPRLNQYYANPDLWLTFGQYREYPEYSMGSCRPFSEDKPIREQPFFASHLKTFYAGLFKKIQPDDLAQEADLAFMIPMLEMAEDHSTFISEILYIENRAALNREDRETVLQSEKIIRGAEGYAPLTKLELEAML